MFPALTSLGSLSGTLAPKGGDSKSVGGFAESGDTAANLNQSFGSNRTVFLLAGLIVLGGLWITRRK